MNKGELVGAVCDRVDGVTRKSVEQVITETIEVIISQVAEGNTVTLVGFGTFGSKEAKERMGRNPQTGEEMTIPACTKPTFKAGKLFKQSVNEGGN